MQLLLRPVHLAGRALLLAIALVTPSFESLWADFEASKKRFLDGVKTGDVVEMVEAVEAMREFDTEAHARLLVDHGLLQEDALVQGAVLESLGGLKESAARQVVLEACSAHSKWEARVSAIQACAKYGDSAYPKLREVAKDAKPEVRSAALRGLVNDRKRETIAFLISAMAGETEEVRGDIQWALKQLTGQDHGDAHDPWWEWWEPVAETFEIPAAKKIEEKPDNPKDQAKDLGTAVRDGLYGDIESEHVAFLFDVSGSMGVGIHGEGTRLEIAKSELQRVLENQLSRDSNFNIITFSDKVKVFGRGLQKATRGKLRRAVKYVEKLRSGGETNAFGALQAAFADRKVDTIFLLSDGQPTVGDETDPKEIHETVADWNRSRKIVINCIGFFPGSAKNQNKKVARAFLKKLALDNGGVYLEVY
ncbi:MAG: HEAT repeat domain-containing protein [Planctomycetota bacterium]